MAVTLAIVAPNCSGSNEFIVGGGGRLNCLESSGGAGILLDTFINHGVVTDAGLGSVFVEVYRPLHRRIIVYGSVASATNPHITLDVGIVAYRDRTVAGLRIDHKPEDEFNFATARALKSRFLPQRWGANSNQTGPPFFGRFTNRHSDGRGIHWGVMPVDCNVWLNILQ